MKLKEFNFIGAKKISLSVSAALIAIILLCSLIFGVRLSVQFSGGTIVLFHAHPPAFYIHPNIRYFQTYSCEIPSAFFSTFIIP